MDARRVVKNGWGVRVGGVGGVAAEDNQKMVEVSNRIHTFDNLNKYVNEAGEK